MNPDPVLRSDLLAAGVPAAVVVIGSLVGFGLWGGSHRLSAWWSRMQEQGWQNEATDEQRAALKRDLQPIVSIYNEL